MKQLLRSVLSERMLAECWDGEVPPYEESLDAAVRLLSRKLHGDISDFTAAVKRWGQNRIRIDGTLSDSGSPKNYYIEVVWLPKSRTFRGTAESGNIRPPPPPKSVEQFVADLNAIVDEKSLILEGQIFQALEGVDETSEELSRARPAILHLFERFPDDESPWHQRLIDILERGDQHDDLLLQSIRRAPSVSAVHAAFRIAYDATTEGRSRWLKELEDIAQSAEVSKWVSDAAKDRLNSLRA